MNDVIPLFRMVDIDTGELHTLEEAGDSDHISERMYDLELPVVMVRVAPPRNVVKLTIN